MLALALLLLTPAYALNSFSSTERQQAAENDYQAWLNSTENGDKVHIGSSTFVRANAADAAKRGINGPGDCQGSWQINVDRTGIWWGSEDTIRESCGCKNGCDAVADQVWWWRYRSGLAMLTANPVQNIINGNDAFNHGYEWGVYKHVVTQTCTGGSNGNIVWAQQLWGWADTATRYCCDTWQRGCSNWQFGHGDWPLMRGRSGQEVNRVGCRAC